MANSYKQYTGDGVLKNFPVTFDYLDKAHVTVSVNGVVSSAYTWNTPTEIAFTNAPAAGAFIDIRRKTPSAAKLVDFVDGSVLKESDLDLQTMQTLFLVQEAGDAATDALTVITGDGNFDARLRRIKNLADPQASTDAATRAYVDQRVDTKQLSAKGTQIRETYTAAANQTLFPLVNTYVPGANQLNIYINSLRQNYDAYTETSANSITFTEGLQAGDVVEVMFIGSTVNAVDSSNVGGASLRNFANDAAAAAGGVAIGSLYRNGSVVMVRVA